MNYSIFEKQPIHPKSIECKYSIVERTDDKIDVLIISFHGKYPDGSLGKNHAKYISRKTISGVIEFDPDAIILDFRELEYHWGNNILDVFEYISFLKDSENTDKDPNFPVSILVSEKSKNGFMSLLIPTSSTTPPNWIFEDINKAIETAIEKGKYWLDN